MEISTCPKCRASVDSSDVFCRECACDLRPAAQPYEDPDGTGIGAASTAEPLAQLGQHPPAQVFFGHFEVVRRLGRGGMGTVYAARDTRLDGELVALKVLHPELSRNPEARARFRREVIVARKLGNPDHIVRVYAPHEEPGDDGLLGFSMELLDGASLADHLAPAGPTSPLSDLTGLARLPWAAALARQIALALDPLHAQDLVHRDIKPSNIMVLDPVPATPDKLRCKLLDFGVVWRGADSSLTGRAQPGTVDYRAPELGPNATGEPSRSSDLFGLGKVLYWALTGKPPIFLFNIAPPSTLLPGLPTGLDGPLLSCFGEPDMRPKSAGALADVFEGGSREVEVAESERKAREKAERKAREKAERKAQEVAEREAKEAAERKAQEAAEREAKEAAEREAQEEAARRFAKEARRHARLEAQQLRKDAEKQKAREEAERKAREEVERKAREEAEQKAQEKAQREAKEEVARRSAEEARRHAHLEAQQLREDAEKQKAREAVERKSRVEARRQARVEAEQLRKDAEKRASTGASTPAARTTRTGPRRERPDKFGIVGLVGGGLLLLLTFFAGLIRNAVDGIPSGSSTDMVLTVGVFTAAGWFLLFVIAAIVVAARQR